MTRKERLRQLKKAKAFFKKDAAARAEEAGAGEAFEDEAEMSEDGGHTSDEEEVEMEENGDGTDRIIKRRVAKRADGLLDREELEEMVDYIDFNDTADDDERRAAKRAAAHARFEEERDEEELRKMQEALKNGFRRPNKNGALGEDGPDYWQRRRKNVGRSRTRTTTSASTSPTERGRLWCSPRTTTANGPSARHVAAPSPPPTAKKATTNPRRTASGRTHRFRPGRDFASQDFKSMIDGQTAPQGGCSEGHRRRRRRAWVTQMRPPRICRAPPAMHRTQLGWHEAQPRGGPARLGAPGVHFLPRPRRSNGSNPGGGGLIRSALSAAAARAALSSSAAAATARACGRRTRRRMGERRPPPCSRSSVRMITRAPTLGGRRGTTHSGALEAGAVPSRLGGGGRLRDRACSACCRRRRIGTRSSVDRTRSRRVSRLRRTSSFGPRRRADETRRARERTRVELRMRLQTT